MIYLRLFYEFFKVGLFSVGGGLATLPFLYDISDTTGWFTHGQLADMLAISESRLDRSVSIWPRMWALLPAESLAR